jgi:hypothetical protein
MKVVALPGSVDERTFDNVVRGMQAEPGTRLLFDAHDVRWVDPYGMVGLLIAGTQAAREAERPLLRLPENPDVLSYLARMRFFEHAAAMFEVHGNVRRAYGDPGSDVLLELTSISSHTDVHTVVDLVNARGTALLMNQLLYPKNEALHFSVVLSEVCQNVIEHAEAPGWVAAQTYNWSKRLGRKVVVIAVMDLGVGFRGSLSASYAARYPGGADGFTDATALEAAFMHGRTRFSDPGRGQGLQQIRKQVARWGGRVSIRSGTARIADVPDWDDALQLQRDLPPLTGAQIGIVLPARVEAGASAHGTRATGERVP